MKEAERGRPGALYPKRYGGPPPQRGGDCSGSDLFGSKTLFIERRKGQERKPLSLGTATARLLSQQPTGTKSTNEIVPPTEKDGDATSNRIPSIETEIKKVTSHTKPGDLSVTFPLLDPERESPTGDQIREANSVGRLLEEQGGHISIPVIAGVSGGILVLGGLGGYLIRPLLAADENVPIGSFPNSFNPSSDQTLIPREEPNKPNPKEVFDNNARSGVIKPSMIERRLEEVKALDPFAKINDNNTVQIAHPIDISSSSNPNAELKYKRKNADSGNEQDRKNRTKEGFLNELTLYDVPAGSIIKARIRGKLTTFVNGNFPINNGYYDAARIDFELPDGRSFGLLITGSTKNRGSIFKSLTNAPAIGDVSLDQQNVLRSKAIPVNPSDPILQVAFEKAEVNFHLIGNFNLSEGKEVIINDNKVLLVREVPTILELLQIDGRLIQD